VIRSGENGGKGLHFFQMGRVVEKLSVSMIKTVRPLRRVYSP